MVDALFDLGSTALNAVKNAAVGAWNGIKAAGQFIADAVKGVILNSIKFILSSSSSVINSVLTPIVGSGIGQSLLAINTNGNQLQFSLGSNIISFDISNFGVSIFTETLGFSDDLNVFHNNIDDIKPIIYLIEGFMFTTVMTMDLFLKSKNLNILVMSIFSSLIASVGGLVGTKLKFDSILSNNKNSWSLAFLLVGLIHLSYALIYLVKEIENRISKGESYSTDYTGWKQMLLGTVISTILVYFITQFGLSYNVSDATSKLSDFIGLIISVALEMNALRFLGGTSHSLYNVAGDLVMVGYWMLLGIEFIEYAMSHLVE